MATGNVSVLLAFLAGVISFLSPCVLPLAPAYIGHLAGTTVAGGFNLDNATITSNGTNLNAPGGGVHGDHGRCTVARRGGRGVP